MTTVPIEELPSTHPIKDDDVTKPDDDVTKVKSTAEDREKKIITLVTTQVTTLPIEPYTNTQRTKSPGDKSGDITESPGDKKGDVTESPGDKKTTTELPASEEIATTTVPVVRKHATTIGYRHLVRKSVFVCSRCDSFVGFTLVS